jgi:hypothetical protein
LLHEKVGAILGIAAALGNSDGPSEGISVGLLFDDSEGGRVNINAGASPSMRMDGGDHGDGLGFHSG